MTQPQLSLTPERFAQGMTFEQYLAYIATPENLRRQGAQGAARRDLSGYLRERYEAFQLREAQAAALRWLGGQPNGPAKALMIAEEWSSDCRRDLPIMARLCEAGGIELRIFSRDGQPISSAPRSDPAESPNADLVNALLRRRGGETFQSLPVVVFLTKDLQPLYTYLEFPAVYHKDRLRGHLNTAKPGETPEQTKKRSADDYAAMLASPMFDVWADAAVGEIISLLYERQVVGSLE